MVARDKNAIDGLRGFSFHRTQNTLHVGGVEREDDDVDDVGLKKCHEFESDLFDKAVRDNEKVGSVDDGALSHKQGTVC